MITILVADDKASSREMIATILSHAGYRVVEAANGEEALALAAAERPDLFLLDLQMPLLDGFGVVEALRRDPVFERVPVLALSAYAMAADRERAARAGFTSYLTKPVNVALLRAELARLLAEPRDPQ